MRVCVVGGGPAGSRTAEALLGHGARVVLYEARPGWEKPCGGGIPERSIESFPFLRDPSLPRQSVRRARIYSGSGREAAFSLAEPLRIYGRRDLNGFLLARACRAGADVRHTRVRGLEKAGRSWRIRDARGGVETFDFLVGADGSDGVVRGSVLGDRAPLEQTLGVGYYLDGCSSGEAVLKFFPGLEGYLWVFPRTDHLAVGICGPAGPGRGKRLLEEVQRFLVDLFGAPVMRRFRKFGARIPSLPSGIPAGRSCQGEGWALVGDAAGFVDPLTREGIHYALASADLLADALARGRPAGYAEAWERSHGEELAWAARHRSLFYSRRFLEAFTLLASASPAVQGVISDLIAGRQPYRTLRRRLIRNAPAVAGSLAQRFLEGFVPRRPSLPPPGLGLPGE